MFWLLASDNETIPQIIIPDGRPELVFHLGAPSLDDRGKVQSRATFHGQLAGPLRVALQKGTLSFGVRLHPWLSRMIADTRANDLVGRETPLDLCHPGFAQDVMERLSDAASFEQMIEAAENAVLAHFRLPKSQILNRISRVITRANESRGDLKSMRESWVGSRRQLEREMVSLIGLTPARYARILRFHAAYDLLSQGGKDLLQVAIDSGYYDLAHLNRDARTYAMLPPSLLAGFSRLGPTVNRPV